MSDAMFNSPVCGIYLLRDADGNVLYVGQSKQVLARLAQHLAAGKSFQCVTVIPCEEAQLDDLEGLLIRAICPPLNGTPGPRSGLWPDEAFHWGAVPPRVRKVCDGITPDMQARIDRKNARNAAAAGRASESRRIADMSAAKTSAGYLSPNEVCAILKIDSDTLNKASKGNPAFPQPIKLSRGITRYRRSDVEEWVAA
jgi:predicted DNA-binding transcriptional regulator AlpA